MWIWQQHDWPQFSFDADAISPLLRQVHFNQGHLLGQLSGEGAEQATLDALLASIVYSSAIEGEKLMRFQSVHH